MTIGELREKLAEFPDMYEVVLCTARGEWRFIEPELTGETRGLGYMRAGLVVSGDVSPRDEDDC